MAAWDKLGITADPGRVHTEGRMVRVALEEAREQVADLFGVRPRQVVLTSGGTESINAAVWGALGARPGPVARAAVEHSAVRDASARSGPVEEIDVDRLGRIEVEAVEAALGRCRAVHGRAAALVHCQWANHEVGTVQPVADVVELCRRHGVITHVDAVAAAGHIPCDVGALDADLVSVSAHTHGRTRRHRCPHRPAGPPDRAVPGRGRAGASPPGWTRERQRGHRFRRRGVVAGPARGPRGRGGHVRGSDRSTGARVPPAWPESTASVTRPIGSPTSCAWASRGSRPSRCSSASTRPGWPPTRAPRVRRSPSNPHRCSRPWAWMPIGRSDCRWAGRPPSPTSRRSRSASAAWWEGSGPSARRSSAGQPVGSSPCAPSSAPSWDPSRHW